jgi:methionyl aminopeptidase
MIELKSVREIAVMRIAGQRLAQVLQHLQRVIAPGMTTADLDAESEKILKQLGGRPAFKGYRGFPASLCTSVNEEIVHGIPGPKQLVAGDIVGMDYGVEVEGYFADAAVTVGVGEVAPTMTELMRTTEEALERGIQEMVVGARLSNISAAVQRHVEAQGYSVVRQFVGHGIGRHIHEDPPVPNYGAPDRGPVLKEGLVLAIEPMVNLGSPDVEILDDGWTVVTKDRQWSAHFEHTIALTADGPEILTQCPAT